MSLFSSFHFAQLILPYLYTLPYSCFTLEELEALSGVNDRDLLDALRDFFEADTDGDLPYVAAEKPWNM